MALTWHLVPALNWPGTCEKCGSQLAAGQRAFCRYEPSALRCTRCHSQLASTHASRPIPLKPIEQQAIEQAERKRVERERNRINDPREREARLIASLVTGPNLTPDNERRKRQAEHADRERELAEARRRASRAERRNRNRRRRQDRAERKIHRELNATPPIPELTPEEKKARALARWRSEAQERRTA